MASVNAKCVCVPRYIISDKFAVLGNLTKLFICMMTSSNGILAHFTGPLWGESTYHRWFSFTKSSDAVLRCFLWRAPEQTVYRIGDTPVILYAIALIVTSQ